MVNLTSVKSRIRRNGRRIHQQYSAGEDRPLFAYSVVLGGYAGLVGLASAIGRARGVRLPARFSVQDTVLLCVATHKASRLVSKEAVTSPLRAPFTSYGEPTGEAEVNESARGHGARHTIGELLTCPFCLGVWIASGLTAGLVFAPKVTRLVSTALTAVAVSDTLQLLYDRAKEGTGQENEEEGAEQEGAEDNGAGKNDAGNDAGHDGAGKNGAGKNGAAKTAAGPHRPERMEKSS